MGKIKLKSVETMVARSLCLMALVAAVVVALPPLESLQNGLGRGYDVVTGQWRAPVVVWNYAGGKTYVDPLTGKKWAIPDEVEVVNTPQVTNTQTNYAIRNISDYQTMQQSWHHLGISLGVLDFKYTKEAMQLSDMMANGTSTVFLTDKFYSFYRMAVWPVDVLPAGSTVHFKQQLDALPASYSPSSAQQYNTFIDTFGTHFAVEADFGGDLRYYTAVDNQLFTKHSEQWVYKQLSIAIGLANFGLGLQNGSNNTEVKNSQDWNGQTNMTITSFGGSSSTVTKGYQTWYNSTVDNPAILRPTIIPISQVAATLRPSVAPSLLSALIDYASSPPS